MKRVIFIITMLVLGACAPRHELPEHLRNTGTKVSEGLAEEGPVDREKDGKQDCQPQEMELVDFQDLQVGLLAKTCNGCHSGAGAAAGIDTSDFQSVFANQERILDSMVKGRMPQFSANVSEDQLNLMAAWMNLGGPETLEELNLCE